MSRIKDMIREMCPNGVEYSTLGKETLLNGFNQIGANELEALNEGHGSVRLLPSSRNYDWACELTDEIKSLVCIGNVITIGRARHPNIKYHEGYFIAAQNHIIRSKDEARLLPRYLYHFLDAKAQSFYTTEGSYPLFTKVEYNKCEIPVPPLEVQREIVRSLDQFTLLTAELTAELQFRQKQYEYYRDNLLDFEGGALRRLIEKMCPNGVESLTIKDCAVVGTGSSDRKDASDNGKYPFYVRSKKIEHKNDFEFDEEAIIIPGEGGVGEIFHYVNGKYALHQRAYRIHFTDLRIITKFAKYYMESQFKDFIMKYAVGATATSIRKPMIENFQIPIPSLDIQQQIVDILDNFNALCSDISEGLPAEIEARQKQYEYYRDKLLTFDVA